MIIKIVNMFKFEITELNNKAITKIADPNSSVFTNHFLSTTAQC